MDKPLSDDLLVAYADNRLDPQTRARMDEQLRNDPAARDTVERLREAHTLLNDTLAPQADEPVPDWLVQAVTAIEPPDQHHADRSGDSAVLAFHPRQTVHHTSWPQALAALLLLGIGLGGGWLGNAYLGAPPPPTAPPTSLLSQALESQPSGSPLQEAQAGNYYEVLPLLSFRDQQGRICREFENHALNAGVQSDHIGIACRGADGQWHTEVLVSQDLPGSAPGAEDGFYAPVAGDQQPDVFEILSATLLRGSTPLDAQQEARLLTQGWQP